MACINVELIEVYIHTNDEQYIYVGRKWTYQASTSDNSIVDTDTIVYLSYAGSTAIYNTSFLAPTKVTIPSGKSSVNFEIEILVNDTSYQKFLSVSGSTQIISTCGSHTIQILSYDSTPKNEYDEILREPGVDCCLFYDKTHELWRDYYPTCMGNNVAPRFPGNTTKDGSFSEYDFYN